MPELLWAAHAELCIYLPANLCKIELCAYFCFFKQQGRCSEHGVLWQRACAVVKLHLVVGSIS